MTPPPPPPPPPPATQVAPEQRPAVAKGLHHTKSLHHKANASQPVETRSAPLRLTGCDRAHGPHATSSSNSNSNHTFALYRLRPDPADPTGSSIAFSDPILPSSHPARTQSTQSSTATSPARNNDLARLILDAFRNPRGPESEPQAHSVSDSAGRRLLARRLHLPHANSPTCTYALPAFLLYDARGLQLFDQLTRLPGDEYYLTKHEAGLLAGGVAKEIASWIQPGSVVVELGCGSMRKTKVILDAIENAVTARAMGREFRANPVRFYALDLDAGELEASLSGLMASPPNSPDWQFITFHGVIGTYTDLQSALLTCPALSPTDSSASRLILWLGSSIGNLTRANAAGFLTALRRALPRSGDRLLLGVDGRNPPAEIERAYNDSHGVTREFELNILRHVNRHLDPMTQLPVDSFEYAGVYNEDVGRHEAYLRAVTDVDCVIRARDDDSTIGGEDSGQDGQREEGVRVHLAEGDLVHIEHSYKYDARDVAQLVGASRWGVDVSWTDGTYALHLMQPIPDNAGSGFVFDPVASAHQGVPSVQEWEQVWNAFDCMSLKLVKQEAWEMRPIKVRLPVCFYVGHLPCFADIQLSRALSLPLLASPGFTSIFERGMDPDLDDPAQCHPHSDVPAAWPAITAICAYRDQVRDRIRTLLRETNDAAAAEALCLVFEHDVMHLETLMYMLAQFSPDLLNNPAAVGLPLAKLTMVAATCGEPTGTTAPRAKTRGFPATTITLGRARDLGAGWGWDNEFPEHDSQVVGPIEVQARPVSVGEYAHFLKQRGDDAPLVPAGWRNVGGGWHVRSIAHNTYLSVARNEEQVAMWPVCVSRIMAQAYAAWWNGQQHDRAGWRLPTEHELRMVYDSSANAFDASTTGFPGGRLAPMPMSPASGLVAAGNVWEWTCTKFAAHAGFAPDPRYPGYSADFFDGKHSVVLGASWATHPRLAARRGFRNWYQDGYTYAQVGFRLVRGDRHEEVVDA